MIALRKPMISVGLLLGIATQVASLALAGENLSVEPEALEVVESAEFAEFAELYQNDPAPIFRAEADSLLATLAMEQNAKLREATMNAYRQLVSELEMYDDETRVVRTTPPGHPEAEGIRTNFLPSS